MTVNLTKLHLVGSHAHELGAAIGPRLRALEAMLADDAELTDETAASILLYCAVAFVIGTEGRGAALQRLAHMVEAAGSDFIEPMTTRAWTHEHGAITELMGVGRRREAASLS
jgi:hypothetical protein